MATLNDLKFDKRNANKHSEYGMAQLEKGLRKNGLGRSILVSADNEIIAGNGATEAAAAIGFENVRFVDTDGTEIIAVRRKDIKSGTKEFYEMALSDNIIAKNNIVMDAEVVDAICEDYQITEYAKVSDTIPIKHDAGNNADESDEGNSGFLNYQRRGEDSEPQQNIFPLAIAISKADLLKWQEYKKSISMSRDSEAFVNLLNSVV